MVCNKIEVRKSLIFEVMRFQVTCMHACCANSNSYYLLMKNARNNFAEKSFPLPRCQPDGIHCMKVLEELEAYYFYFNISKMHFLYMCGSSSKLTIMQNELERKNIYRIFIVRIPFCKFPKSSAF